MEEIKNSYPELPVIAFRRTTVEMPMVVVFAKSLQQKYLKETLIMAYAIFRNESGNGMYGVNNNYAGIQADCGRWRHLPGNPEATCIKKDNGGAMRRFLCFSNADGYKISFELLCIKITERNMSTADDYFSKWVGNGKPAADARKNFESLLHSGAKIFV
jgi:hypothetical protein